MASPSIPPARVARALRRHGLSLDEAGRRSDTERLRLRGVGAGALASLRSAVGGPPSGTPTVGDGWGCDVDGCSRRGVISVVRKHHAHGASFMRRFCSTGSG
jgi:hypothetical protein